MKQPTDPATGGRTRVQHRGSVLIVALVCLLVVSLLAGSIVRMAILHRKQVRREQHRLQADWLVSSGLERAVNRLMNDAAYRGEIWRIPADQIGGQHTADVRISVASIPADGSHKKLRVEARFPSNRQLFATRSTEIIVRVRARETDTE